jgi:hypothetical protein
MGTVTLLLPASARLAGHLPPALAAALGRADVVAAAGAGERAQLLRNFDVLPRGWPVAALTRQRDAGDAAGSLWLRADPAWVRPDISGARLFACGEGLQPTREDCDALLPSLRPLFGDAGFQLDAPAPSRWYLRLPPGSKLPAFADPSEALGADVFEFLPADAGGDAALARRWRSLLNEAQVVLHNHPWNARRAAAGQPPINSLWFWGAGAMPDQVGSCFGQVETDDALLAAFAAASGSAVRESQPRFPAGDIDASQLIDLRGHRDLSIVSHDWLLPALAAMNRRRIDEIRLDFPDVAGLRLQPRQRWRFWRKLLDQLSNLPAIAAPEAETA